MTRPTHFLPVALLVCTGCVNMSGLDGGSKYACAAPDGVACDSVSGTYANALHHNLPSQRADTPTTGSRTSAAPAVATTAGVAAGATPARPAQAGGLPTAAGSGPDGRPGATLRSPARVLRLWTKPWEDADGDLWDQGYVYVQVEAGRWQLDHVQQRIRDRFVPLQLPVATPAPVSAPPLEPGGPTDAATDGLSRALGASPFGPFPSAPSFPRPPTAPAGRLP